jgi:hypothetical protein
MKDAAFKQKAIPVDKAVDNYLNAQISLRHHYDKGNVIRCWKYRSTGNDTYTIHQR